MKAVRREMCGYVREKWKERKMGKIERDLENLERRENNVEMVNDEVLV